MSRWEYDRRVQRYRDKATGRFLGESALHNLIRQNQNQMGKAAQQVARELVNGKTTVGQFALQMRKVLKELHIGNYLLGRGGTKSLKASDYGKIGGILSREYAYLRGLCRDLALGKVTSGQFLQRLGLFVSQSRNTYEYARRESHQAAGFMYERRVRHALESCAECIAYAARGWQPIGTLPAIGTACSCRANCKCSFEYRREPP